MAPVRVMTWNVENLFLPGDDAGPDTQATFDRKIASLAAVIDAQAPDILALQEVGPPDALDHLRSALTHVLPHAELGDPDGRGICVALLSTRPLANPTRIRTLPVQIRPVQVRDPVWGDDAVTDQMGRGALAATVTVDGTPVTVITAHFKSKLISYPRQAGIVTGSQWQPNDEGERLRYAGYAVNLRTAEAMTIRAHLDGLLHNPADPDDGTGRATAVVFAGDLNDEPEAATTHIIKGAGGSEIDPQPGSGFARPDRHDGYRMWNLAPLLPDGPNGEPPSTRVYRGRGELIDHIFASHRLVNPDNLPPAHTALVADPCRRWTTGPPTDATNPAPTTPPSSPRSTSETTRLPRKKTAIRRPSTTGARHWLRATRESPHAHARHSTWRPCYHATRDPQG